ncbi:hypothetical protein GYB29_01210 [bacterium]|nr:hypothetical protein [bacterium]
MSNPTFEEVSNFLRNFTGVSSRKKITKDTWMEDDLDITGIDGLRLFEESEIYFGISFPSEESKFKELFELTENENLFGSEGFDPIGISLLIGWIRKKPKPIVKDLSVGKFHQVLIKLKQTQSVA